MTELLKQTDLVRSLSIYWRETFPVNWPTISPGQQADASQWEAWVELTFPFLTERISRSGGCRFVDFTWDVHCFSARQENLQQARQMVDATRKVLSRQVVAVRDFDLSALPSVGFARLTDAEVRDLSRVTRTLQGRPLSHFLVSVRGLAQLAGD